MENNIKITKFSCTESHINVLMQVIVITHMLQNYKDFFINYFAIFVITAACR